MSLTWDPAQFKESELEEETIDTDKEDSDEEIKIDEDMKGEKSKPDLTPAYTGDPKDGYSSLSLA